MGRLRGIKLKSRHLLIIFIAVCIVLMGLSLLSSKTRGPLRYIAGYTVVPMQKGFNKLGGWASDFTQNFQTIKELRTENKKLQQQIDDLTVENGELALNQKELTRLEELFKLDQNYGDYPKVGARVIASNTSNWFNSFTIDKGKKDGIRVNMNVIAGSGLVGIVTEVGPNWSTVRSIIDDTSYVSGMMLTSGEKCMVQGNLKLAASGKMKFEDLPVTENEEGEEVKIEEGEQVVTSYISNKFLQGILIGYVSEIKTDESGLTRYGYLTPAADFSDLQDVLVITQTKAETMKSNNGKD